MSPNPATFFDNAYDPESRNGVRRDQYGRPMLVPAGRPTSERQWYTSMSSLAGMLSNTQGLHTWEKRLLARGLGARPDLYGLASAVAPLTGDPQYDRLSNAEVDQIIERALDHAGCDVLADYGTAIHGHTDPGADRNRVPEVMREDVLSYDRTMASATQVLSEAFVAHDGLRAAGSLDGTYRFLGVGHILADKKTGKFKPLECAIQMAGYRDAQIYNVHTDEREDWPADLHPDLALVIHIPYGQHRTDLHWIDLRLGRQLAATAAMVRDQRQWANKSSDKKLAIPFDPIPVGQATLLKMLEQTTQRSEVDALYRRYPLLWTDEHAKVAQRMYPGQP